MKTTTTSSLFATNHLCAYVVAVFLLAVETFTAQAAVTVSDFGATAPVLDPASDTGHTIGVPSNEFPLSGSLTFGQSFKLTSSAIVDKVYFNYRAFGLNDTDGLVNFTFRLDVNNDGSYEIDQQFVGVDKSNFQTGNVPSWWIEFDLSAANITLAAATTHAVYWNSDNPSGQEVATVRYDNSNPYSDGTALGNVVPGGTRDAWFAVTTVPEPSIALLGAFGVAAVLFRHRTRNNRNA